MSIVSAQDGSNMLFILEDPVAVRHYTEPPDLPHINKPIVVTQLKYSESACRWPVKSLDLCA